MLISFILGSFSLWGVMELSFQYYIEMNIHHRVTAFENSVGKRKRRKPKPLFFPFFMQLWTCTAPLGEQSSTEHPCASGHGLWALLVSPQIGPRGQYKCKSFEGWGLQEQWEQWGVALELPQGDEGTWVQHILTEPILGGGAVAEQLWAAVTRTAVSSPPALKKTLQIIRKMDKRALMAEWNGVDMGLGTGSLWHRSEM